MDISQYSKSFWQFFQSQKVQIHVLKESNFIDHDKGFILDLKCLLKYIKFPKLEILKIP